MHVVDNAATRELLRAIADALPEEGQGVLTGLSVRQGWGGIVNVRLHTSEPPSYEWGPGREMREAVQVALDGRRHDLAVIWDPAAHPARTAFDER